MQGQGIIELMATFLIIAMSVSALVYFQNNLAFANSLTQQQQTALSLATSQIETLRDFKTLTGANSYQSISSGTSSITNLNTTYAMSWTVTTNTNPNYKTIDLSISWTDRRNTNQTLRLITIVGGTDPSYSGTIME